MKFKIGDLSCESARCRCRLFRPCHSCFRLWRRLAFDFTIVRRAQERSGADGLTDVVVLGIGGSALGPIALRTALRPPQWNLLDDAARLGKPRLHVLDNVDPANISALLGRLDAQLLDRPPLGRIDTSTGGHLTTGGTWANASSRMLKHAFQAVDTRAVLGKVITSSALAKRGAVPAPQTSVAQLGQKLMADYILPLEVLALLLTAAMIGAVIIARKER